MPQVDLGLVITAFNNAGAGLRAAGAEVKQLGAHAQETHNRLKAIQIVLAGIFIQKSVEYFKQYVEGAVYIENARLRLVAFAGGIKEAEKVQEELASKFNSSGLKVDDLVGSFNRLRAGVKSNEQDLALVGAITNSVLALGKGQEQVDNLTVSFQQLGGKGYVSARQLNSIIADTPLKLADIAKAAGKSYTEFDNQLRLGFITAEKFQDAFIKASKAKFGDYAEYLKGTLAGARGDISNAIAEAIGGIGTKTNANIQLVVFFHAIAAGIRNFSSSIDQSKIDAISKFFRDLEPTVSKLTVTLGQFAVMAFSGVQSVANISKQLPQTSFEYGIIGYAFLGTKGAALGAILGDLDSKSGTIANVIKGVVADIKGWPPEIIEYGGLGILIGGKKFGALGALIGAVDAQIKSLTGGVHGLFTIFQGLGADLLEGGLVGQILFGKFTKFAAMIGMALALMARLKSTGRLPDPLQDARDLSGSVLKMFGYEGPKKTDENEKVPFRGLIQLDPWTLKIKKAQEEWEKLLKLTFTPGGDSGIPSKLNEAIKKIETLRSAIMDVIALTATKMQEMADATQGDSIGKQIDIINRKTQEWVGNLDKAKGQIALSSVPLRDQALLLQLINDQLEFANQIRKEAIVSALSSFINDQGGLIVARATKDTFVSLAILINEINQATNKWVGQIESAIAAAEQIKKPTADEIQLQKMLNDLLYFANKERDQAIKKTTDLFNADQKIFTLKEQSRQWDLQNQLLDLKLKFSNDAMQNLLSGTPGGQAYEQMLRDTIGLNKQLADIGVQIAETQNAITNAMGDPERTQALQGTLNLLEKIKSSTAEALANLSIESVIARQFWKELGAALHNDISDGLTGIIEKTKTWGDMAKAILHDLTRLSVDYFLKLAEANLMEMSMGGMGSTGSDATASFLGNLVGGAIPKFASGGVVTGSTIANIGEAGPEGVFPLTRGRDGKLGIRGGGGDTYQITVQAIDTQSGLDFIAQNIAAIDRGMQHRRTLNRR